MYLLSVCSPCPGSLGCPATAAQAPPPSSWPPSQRAPPPTQLLHRSPSRSLSAPLLRSVSSSPTGAASSSSSRNAAGRSAPRGAGGAQAPSIENLGGLSFDPSSGPQILGCPQDFLSTSNNFNPTPRKPVDISYLLPTLILVTVKSLPWYLLISSILYYNGDKVILSPLTFYYFVTNCNDNQQ